MIVCSGHDSDFDWYFFCQVIVYNPYDPDFCQVIVYNPYDPDFCPAIVYSPCDPDFCLGTAYSPYVPDFCLEIVYNTIVSGNRGGRLKCDALVSKSVDLLVCHNRVMDIARVTFDPQNVADSCSVDSAHQGAIDSIEQGRALDRCSSVDLCRGNYPCLRHYHPLRQH